MGIIFNILKKVFPLPDPELQEEIAARKAQEAQEAKLQEVITSIERLNPEWQVKYNMIMFVKDTEDGIYSGSMGYENEYSTGWGYDSYVSDSHGSSYISVTLSNGPEVINIFCESWNYPYFKIKNYVVNHLSYREQISKQELERTRAIETEQKKKEAEKEIKDRLLDRFLSRT